MSFNIDLNELSQRENENETREARNGILMQLMESKGQIEPFDKRPNPNTDEKDMDLLLFRDCMSEMNLVQASKPLENYFSDRE